MNDLINYLLNYAFDHQIGYELTKSVPPDCPSAASVSNRFIIINSNWKNPYEIPFMIGHEIGHVMKKHVFLKCQSPAWKIKLEKEADVFSLNLIYDYAMNQLNPINDPQVFLKEFGIPQRMSESVNLLFMKKE